MTALALIPVSVAALIFVATFRIRRDSSNHRSRMTLLPPEPVTTKPC